MQLSASRKMSLGIIISIVVKPHRWLACPSMNGPGSVLKISLCARADTRDTPFGSKARSAAVGVPAPDIPRVLL